MHRGKQAFGIAVLGALAACAGAPAGRPPEIAPSSFRFAVDSFRGSKVVRGVDRYFVYSKVGPWAINVLDVRLDRCFSAIAVKGVASAVGRFKTSDLLARVETDRRDVVGGVNADFFSLATGVPVNALVIRGRVYTPPSLQPAFAVDSAGIPHIVNFNSFGDAAFAADDPALASMSLAPFHPMEAVGGRPRLLRDSVIVLDVDTVGGPSFATARHPRTAVGIANNGRRLFLVVVDGRRLPYSDGMTLRELARLMLSLGARDALNLDGGGSTTMLVENAKTRQLEIVNRPSDATGERFVGDALAIVKGCGKP